MLAGLEHIERCIYPFPNTGGAAVSGGAHSPTPIA